MASKLPFVLIGSIWLSSSRSRFSFRNKNINQILPTPSLETMSSPQYFGNVNFLGVARVAGQGIVVASHSYNTEIDLNGVRQVLEQPNMSIAPGKHYSFGVAQVMWHLISGQAGPSLSSYTHHFTFASSVVIFIFMIYIVPSDDAGLIYILICKTSYPQRCAHTCLEELQRTVSAKIATMLLFYSD